jgi:mannose-6-phosphate isomerase-like protein (cupin superfamily)
VTSEPVAEVDEAQIFRYEQPSFERGKRAVRLVRSPRVTAAIQVVKDGGETNLHSHPHMDGFWMVLSGRARFYCDKTTVMADLGPLEGVFIPRNFKYWFEAASEEPLEIIQVECTDVDFAELRGERRRIDHTPFTRRDPADLISEGVVASVAATPDNQP